MKICLLGATGRVGSILLEKMIKAGYEVSILVRQPLKVRISSTNLSIIQGDVLIEANVEQAMTNCDMVVSCLGTDGKDTLSKSMPLLLKTMRQKKIKSIISIGTAGILQARSYPTTYRFLTNESKRKSTKAAEDHLKVYLMLHKSKMNWTIVCPTYLPNGERQGHYRIEKNMLPESSQSISIYDTADFMYDLLISNEFLKTRVGIAY
ncbi:NAD(P)-dependent oxidoreductase [Bacillus sp. 2205SS5-2]|uniref:NAD(P)-dependent oxidoreductase n=1 Tax=Bacillus sp. 2205SS5-2 TaxID=3109031 RepID=UPI0030066A3E